MKHMLIVDDETEQLRSLRVGLTARGYKVNAALSAQEALNFLSNEPDKETLVITDYVMPGMDGLILLEKMREMGSCAPSIVMTAYGEKNVVMKALRCGCDGFIEKPFNIDELIDEIHRVERLRFSKTDDRVVSETLPELVHQIRNPLCAIKGNAELGKLRIDDLKFVGSCLAAILNAVDRISAINNKTLATLRMRASDCEPRKEKVNISELLEICLDMFKSLIVQHRISVKRSLPGFPWHVLGDRFLLEQVFANLIVNAIQSMENAPEKTLHVSTVVNEGSSTVSIVIRDTGCGIPQESLNRVFEPYFTSKKTGIGLGLNFVKTIVKDHCGRVEVESSVGKGTTLTVIFPIELTRHCRSGE